MFDDQYNKSRNILARQQWKILDKAQKDWRPMTERQALEIARNQQRNNGTINNKTLYLTETWKAYSNFSSEERAIYRRSKETWRPMSHYMYVDWRAVLRDEFRKIKKR